MTDPQESYQSITLADLRKFVDNKLVDTGVPGILMGIAITQAVAQQWIPFALFFASASASWIIIRILKKVAPKVEEAVDQAIDQTIDNWEVDRINRSDFQLQYLEALKHHCYNLKVEGFQGYLPRLALEEVYVPLRLLSKTPYAIAQNPVQQIWDLLPKEPQRFPHQRLAILAKPGYGKTTLSRHLTLCYANGTYEDYKVQGLIPVLLLFRDFHEQIQGHNTPSLPDLIVSTVQNLPRCEELQTSGHWFRDRLHNGDCLVILDGLDEVPDAQRKQVSRWANWQLQNYASQFILTSRPHGYQSDLFDGVEQVEILDFTNDEKQTFIERWYRFITWELIWKRNYEESQQDLDERKHLSRQQAKEQSNAEAQAAATDLTHQLFASRDLTDLAKNPLLITIIVATHEAYSVLPKGRIDLYDKIFKLLLEYRPQRRKTRLTLPTAEANQTILQLLALRLVEAETTQFTPQQGIAWIQDRLQRTCSEDITLSPKQFLQEIQKLAGLLAGGEGQLYEFTHKTFQEYLTALEINETGQVRLLENKLFVPAWEEPICFYAAMSDATRLVQALLDQLDHIESAQSEDWLKLANRLKNESRELDADVRERLNQQLLALSSVEYDAQTQLEQRFQTLTPLNDTCALSDWITWGEYELFLQDQATGQFHSQATVVQIASEQMNQPVTEISAEDGRWFCAWLSTQGQLQPETGVVHFRWPTEAEQQQISGNDSAPTDGLRVVREQIPDRYQALLNYLANGRWKEADQATEKVMLEVANRTKQGYLDFESIQEFPCFDLRLVDHLWVKFSGGKWGFSVQKQIYVDCGATLDGKYPGDEIWNKFCDRVGWRKENEWVSYSSFTFDLIKSLPGQFPLGVVGVRLWGFVWFLFSRAQTCEP